MRGRHGYRNSLLAIFTPLFYSECGLIIYDWQHSYWDTSATMAQPEGLCSELMAHFNLEKKSGQWGLGELFKVILPKVVTMDACYLPSFQAAFCYLSPFRYHYTLLLKFPLLCWEVWKTRKMLTPITLIGVKIGIYVWHVRVYVLPAFWEGPPLNATRRKDVTLYTNTIKLS